jgi:RimJ/RimL family protein N-acetyltransferase
MRTTEKSGSRCAISSRIRTQSKTRTNSCIEVEGVAAGGIGIDPGQDVHRQTAGLGYWLGEEFWGRGVMTEAVAAFTDFCFNNFSASPNLCRGVREQSGVGACS